MKLMIEQEKLNNLNNREKKLEREEKMCGAEEVLKNEMLDVNARL